ncbi:hypothetical protein [Heyndrickxia oleronia]|uniref:hypothetical protein n=1 Tax=Heyndrickxia oleronia TaxID=38875 RepID=UPI001B0D3931|nr:hypothetical protein [Heyndrickxia oleronia]GIN41417.1 hypothetical protein J19TS1_43660 [Heyndrickxia oleronia]
MRKLLLFVTTLLISMSINYGIFVNQANASSSYTETPTSDGGKIIEWSSNTYVQYWWEEDDPNTIMYTSEFTGGVVKIKKQDFFNSIHRIQAQSVLPVPDYIQDTGDLQIEFVSKSASIPSETMYSVELLANHQLKINVLSTPFLAKNAGEIFSTGPNSAKYLVDLKLRITIPGPPSMTTCNNEGSYLASGSGSSLVKTIKIPVYDEDGDFLYYDYKYYYDYLTTNITDLSKKNVQAGFGYEFKVVTDYSNEYYGMGDGWYGAQRVVAYFPSSDSFLPKEVELEPLYPTTNWHNEWILPRVYVEKFSGNMFYSQYDANRDVEDELLDGGNKWYTPFKQKDGPYNFYIRAYNAGKNSISAADSDWVGVCGSPFDDYVVRLVRPDNPFPAGVGSNWQGSEAIITNLVDWYYEKHAQGEMPAKSDEWVN